MSLIRESLRTLVFREAGEDEQRRLELLRYVAPHIYIAGGYDVDELRELRTNDAGSEYVSASWPEVPVLQPLSCIVIRPFSREEPNSSPYELVAKVAGHLRDLLADAVNGPDYDGTIRHAYIEPGHAQDWSEAVRGWRALQVVGEVAEFELVKPSSDIPTPLTTGQTAVCFDGLRWSERQWKKPLGDRPRWLEACLVSPGRRGVSEAFWNPVSIACALVQRGHISARSARARFQTRPLLKPWLELWKAYEAEYLDDQ